MRQLVDSIIIDAPPDTIWQWLADLPAHYTEWHPDHVSAVWERGGPDQIGSIMRAVEFLGGIRETLRMELTRVDPPHRFEYRMRGPISLLLPGGAFSVISHNGASRFTASISYRMGTLTERFFKDRVAALTRHMREEGESLKRIIESTR